MKLKGLTIAVVPFLMMAATAFAQNSQLNPNDFKFVFSGESAEAAPYTADSVVPQHLSIASKNGQLGGIFSQPNSVSVSRNFTYSELVKIHIGVNVDGKKLDESYFKENSIPENHTMPTLSVEYKNQKLNCQVAAIQKATNGYNLRMDCSLPASS